MVKCRVLPAIVEYFDAIVISAQVNMDFTIYTVTFLLNAGKPLAGQLTTTLDASRFFTRWPCDHNSGLGPGFTGRVSALTFLVLGGLDGRGP